MVTNVMIVVAMVVVAMLAVAMVVMAVFVNGGDGGDGAVKSSDTRNPCTREEVARTTQSF